MATVEYDFYKQYLLIQKFEVSYEVHLDPKKLKYENDFYYTWNEGIGILMPYQWCVDNVGESMFLYVSGFFMDNGVQFHTAIFKFLESDDAILFKMIWC